MKKAVGIFLFYCAV